VAASGAHGGRIRRARAALGIVALVVVAVLLAVGLSGKRGAAARPAPPLPAQALVGRSVTLAQLLGSPSRGRHAALVLFWASWCTPCQQEAPAVERFARSAVGRGRIVGVDYGESELALPRAFLRRYGWTFPTLSDPYLRAGSAYDVANLPATFVVDAHGRIRERLYGPQTDASLTHALRAAEG
jgi:thiol-disulfide isomerase/thioredoxin